MSNRLERLRSVAAAAFCGAVLLAAGVPAAMAEEARVIMTADESYRMYFEPGELTVAPGTTVVFANEDGSNHKVKFADGGGSERLREGATYSRTFTAPGEYPYSCVIHSKMTGKIIVK